nr:hypothetical protein GCM10020092_050680 [Actinoplanes digitatis]
MALWTAATEADTVGGVPARFVAAPADTAQAAEVLRAAAADDLAVVVRGGGSKLDWGMPPRRLDLIVDTRNLTGVVEHAAGDLIVVVRASTPLAGLDLGDQQLALDPVRAGATVGGTVAANTSGPRRLGYGTVRDLLIGITVVRPGGMVARAGGKVVKNVAGYDLGKLFTGSYGTLGLITECAFRLHPRPAAHALVVRTAPAGQIGALLAAVRAEQVVPAAVEIDAPAEGPVTLAVLVEGTAAGGTGPGGHPREGARRPGNRRVPAVVGRVPVDRGRDEADRAAVAGAGPALPRRRAARLGRHRRPVRRRARRRRAGRRRAAAGGGDPRRRPRRGAHRSAAGA